MGCTPAAAVASGGDCASEQVQPGATCILPFEGDTAVRRLQDRMPKQGWLAWDCSPPHSAPGANAGTGNRKTLPMVKRYERLASDRAAELSPCGHWSSLNLVFICEIAKRRQTMTRARPW